MIGLRIIVDARCIFHNCYFTLYNRDWNSNSGTNFSMTCCKCSIYFFSRNRTQDRNTWNIKYEFLSNFNLGVKLSLAAGIYLFQKILSIFNLGTNLSLTGGKYVIKIIFDIKIKISIFKISNVLIFNKFWAFLILGLIWA